MKTSTLGHTPYVEERACHRVKGPTNSCND